MSIIDVYQVHAFSEHLHGGNPAGVCLLDSWPEDEKLRQIAQDVGPSVTAFVLDSRAGSYPLRWFTRGGREVNSFCGHATFSAAHVLLHERHANRDSLSFETVSGIRQVGQSGQYMYMTVPAWLAEECICPEVVIRSVGRQPAQCFRGPRDYLLIFNTVEEVQQLTPDYSFMGPALGHIGVIATARGGEAEIVHRFFCPGFSIAENEDQATGSAMSTLVPYWTARLGVSDFRATQLSPRGGFFLCSRQGDVITIRSNCITFLVGTLHC